MLKSRGVDLEAAARKLGVHYQTAYRWVRGGTLRALKVGSGYEIDPEDVERLIAQQRFGPSALGDPDLETARLELYEGLRARDEIGAQFLVERLHAEGAAPVLLCETLIGPALARLEEDLRAGALSTLDVALATGICERLVGSLATPPRGRPRGLAVVASPPGEHHRIPGLMATAALRGERWRVHHLGTDVPNDELGEFVRATGPDVLVLSVAVADDAASDARRHALTLTDAPVLIHVGASLARLLHEMGESLPSSGG